MVQISLGKRGKIQIESKIKSLNVGRYSKIPYDLKPLNFHMHFKPKNNDTKNYLNTIHNQIMFTIKKLNLITEHRVKLVNKFRKLDLEQDILLHQKTFEKMDTKQQEKELNQQYSPVLNYIVIDTEIYFLYAKILFDYIAEIICYYEDDLPSNTKNNFSTLYRHILENGCNNRHLQYTFQRNLKWYPLMIQSPRNNLLVHDKTTSGMSWNDHGVDINVGKSGWTYHSDEDLIKLLIIYYNHKDEFTLGNHGNYIAPILREFIRKPEVFLDKEIKILYQITDRFPVFPYVVDVHSRIQEFLSFMSTMVQIVGVEGYW